MMQPSYNNAWTPMPQVFVYQVEFNAIATGKIVAMSKRRIRWRYGFPNQEAIDAGRSGMECRGEEHDVTLVWSVSSGKRMIMSNGKQIYIGTNKSSIFEHQWTDTRGNIIRMVAHATAPISSASGSRQYDLHINGKSFFTLPKPYEIGLKGPSEESRIPGVITQKDQESLGAPQRHLPSYSPSGRTMMQPKSQEEEMDDLKRAIEASLQESRAHLANKGRLEEGSAAASSVKTPQTPQESHPPKSDESLIDFFSDPLPTAAAPAPVAQNQNALVLLDDAPQQHQVDPFAYNTAPQFVAPAVDEFAPKAPTYNDISDQILLNYNSTQNVNSAVPAMQSQQYPPQNQAVTMNPFDDPNAQHHGTMPPGQQMNGYYNMAPPQQYQQQGYGFSNQM